MKLHRRTWLTFASLLLASGLAHSQDLGQAGPSYVGAGSWPSGDKPQSKLWFHDGSWWGSLFSTTARVYRIHRLDLPTRAWVDTGTTIDTRNTAHADCLSVGDKLYVGSHHYQDEGFDGFPMLLFRYSYLAASKAYSLDPGFPVQVSNSSTEAMTIARDSTERLWAVWTAGSRVWITHSLADDLSWATPFVLPVNTTDIAPGDICQIVAFQGNRVGVMWSDHRTDAFWFTYHQDGTSPAAWSVPEPAQSGPDQADDHIHMKATADGRVFAILKNELDETWVRVRDLAGNWSGHIVSAAADGWTRSILAIDEESRRLMVFGTEPVGGGTIYVKLTSLDAPSFAPGRGFPFLRNAADPALNDATSTKQSVSSATGLVVLASHQPSRRYWFRGVPLRPTGVRPMASFAAQPRSGSVPLEVRFTDTSSGEPTSWFWTFGDGATSTERNPRHVYRAVGDYTVSLEVSNAAGNDVRVEPALIEVTGPRVVALDDTFVRPGNNQKDWGGHPHLRTREKRGSSKYETFLRFDLSGIDPAVIGSTFLRLYAEDGTGAELNVYVVAGGWDEHGLTWDSRPRKLQRVAAGDVRHDGWIEIEFGPALGNGEVHLALVADDDTKAKFSSKEGSHPPELVTMPPR